MCFYALRIFFSFPHILKASGVRYTCKQTLLPMNEDSTPSLTSEFAALVRRALKQEKERQPRATVVRCIKDFAHNYRANTRLTEGLQSYMLS